MTVQSSHTAPAATGELSRACKREQGDHPSDSSSISADVLMNFQPFRQFSKLMLSYKPPQVLLHFILQNSTPGGWLGISNLWGVKGKGPESSQPSLLQLHFHREHQEAVWSWHRAAGSTAAPDGKAESRQQLLLACMHGASSKPHHAEHLCPCTGASTAEVFLLTCKAVSGHFSHRSYGWVLVTVPQTMTPALESRFA